MQKFKRLAILLLVITSFLVGVVMGMRLGGFLGGRSRGQVYNTPVLLQQIQTLSQLVTVQYVLEKAVVWDDPPQTILGQFFAGDNRVLLLAHGVVKAGVDLGKLTPDDLHVNGKTIVIALPRAQITDAYLNDSQTKVIERSTGFMRSFDKDLEQTVRESAVDDIRRAARTGGILKDAEERAQKELAGLLLQLGFEKVDFQSTPPRNVRPLNLTPTAPAETPGR